MNIFDGSSKRLVNVHHRPAQLAPRLEQKRDRFHRFFQKVIAQLLCKEEIFFESFRFISRNMQVRPWPQKGVENTRKFNATTRSRAGATLTTSRSRAGSVVHEEKGRANHKPTHVFHEEETGPG